jgi:hypothetical protein
MKRLITLSSAIFFMAAVWAQSPELLNYQAVVRNSAGEIVTTAVGMQIRILQGPLTPGVEVYIETQTPTPNENGLVTIEIGADDPAAFAAINWSAGSYFIETSTDPAGGTSYSIVGTSQLLSVPYALFAKNGYTHYMGELYGGGIIVGLWLDNGVEHGLIASLTDLSGTAAWSDVTNGVVPGGALNTVDGAPNTVNIIEQSTTGAAELCGAYSYDGFDDWYLPAIWELNMCYDAAMWVNSILGQTNGFWFSFYWSSTESTATMAWYKNFETGLKNDDALKSATARVRAVRRF